jgi:hypothetical protein
VLLDAARTLAANDPLVDRMILVAIDIDNLAILQMHPDATAASTHVTGGGFYLIPAFGGEIDGGFSGHVLQTHSQDDSFVHHPLVATNWSTDREVNLSGPGISHGT